MVQTRTLFLIVWTGGGLTGSQSERQFQLRVSFDARLNWPIQTIWSFVSNTHFFTLSHLLLLTLVLFPETWKLQSF